MNGILTASDARYFPGLKKMVDSWASSSNRLRWPLRVVDLGLTDEQKDHVVSQGAVIQQIDLESLVIPSPVYFWGTWNKPLYIQDSPFDVTLWIDADTLIVGDLEPLFAAASERPLIIDTNLSGASLTNAADLYRRYPTPRRLPHTALNAGVLGFSRKEIDEGELFSRWMGMIMAASDPEVRALLQWFDQGALLWALERVEKPAVLYCKPEWNRLVPGFDYVRGLVESREGDVVWHFAGYKPFLLPERLQANGPALGANTQVRRFDRYGPLGPNRGDPPSNSTRGFQDMLVKLPPLGRVAEVGCHGGVSTETLALMVDHVTAVDSWEGTYAPSYQWFMERMKPYSNVTAVREESAVAARRFESHTFDLVYIDANHDRKSVKRDIKAWKSKVKPHGWLAGHDYHPEFSGVIEAVNELLGKPDQVAPDSSWIVRL